MVSPGVLQPCQIKDIVVLAADELDAAIAGLGGGEIAVVLGRRGAQGELSRSIPFTVCGGPPGVIRRRCGQVFALVEGKRRKETGTLNSPFFPLKVMPLGFRALTDRSVNEQSSSGPRAGASRPRAARC